MSTYSLNTGNGQHELSVTTRPKPLTASTGKKPKVIDQESVDNQRKLKEDIWRTSDTRDHL